MVSIDSSSGIEARSKENAVGAVVAKTTTTSHDKRRPNFQQSYSTNNNTITNNIDGYVSENDTYGGRGISCKQQQQQQQIDPFCQKSNVVLTNNIVFGDHSPLNNNNNHIIIDGAHQLKNDSNHTKHNFPNSCAHSSFSFDSNNSIFKSVQQFAQRLSFDSPTSNKTSIVERSQSNHVKSILARKFPIVIKKTKSKKTMASSSSFSTPPPNDTSQNTSSSYPLFDSANESNNHEQSENSNNFGTAENSGSDAKRQQTYKDRRKNYRLEKKKLADELISAIQDPTTVVMSDWLKVRTTLKQWNKYFCELRPGSLYLYKNQKTHKPSNWIGTVMLKMCELIERPSKKNGFCFKLFHPLEHPIWSPKGPHGEEYTSFMFPLPISSVIFRAPSEEAGRKWMEAIELSLKCSDLLHHKHVSNRRESMPVSPLLTANNSSGSSGNAQALQSLNLITSIDRSDDEMLNNQSINDMEIEKHFDLDDDGHTDHGEHDDSQGHRSTEDSDDSIFEDELNGVEMNDEQRINDEDGNKSMAGRKITSSRASSKKVADCQIEIIETNYVYDGGYEEFGLVGDAGQTEDVAEENKSLLWTLLKQVRPGMDLSKVVLPTFILEPRSFLEKLADYYYHCDIISKAASEDDPLMRMKLILKWYLSGFYKKPKGLKKPYNPILGETFRCCWHHPETDSRTFFIAEQVSHHPPISAFYVTNRKDGYCISGSILAKSKFYGNSISAILEGTARLTLLARGEDYLITFPYAHCKGIFWGPLAFELGGKVMITCEKTGYKSELEFKLKPFFSSEDQCNLLVGKLRLGNETMGNIDGHWDSIINYKDKRTGLTEVFWSGIDPLVKKSRLKRFVVPIEEQLDNESEKLWLNVTLAIQKQDQNAATEEKTKLEEAQRDAAKQRNSRMEMWIPKHFVLDNRINDWLYKMAEMRPWDNRTDVKQYERDYIIRTLTRHLNSKLNYMRSIKKNGPQHMMIAGGAGSTVASSAAKQERFRRQHTCADPTSMEYNLTKVVDPSSLESTIVTMPTDTVSMNKYFSRNLESILQKLSTLHDSTERLKEELTMLKTEVVNLRSAVNISHQLTSGKINGESLIKSDRPASTFAITKLQIRLLLETIPAEIRLVIIVLLANLILNHLFRHH